MIEDLTSCILDFQANMIGVTYRKKTTVVEPEVEPTHTTALVYIWNSARVLEDPDSEGGTVKWRKLGFDTENLVDEFGEVGVLGLDCLVRAHIYQQYWLFRACAAGANFICRRISLHKIQTTLLG